MNCKHCICFSLSFNESINFFLPSAYIAEVDNALIGYIQKKASFETAASFEIEFAETTLKLISICDDLKIEALQRKYNVKNKVKKSLQELLKESSFSKIIQQYIAYKLNLFLEEIKRFDFPLAVNFNRYEAFHSQKLVFSTSDLFPKLHFQKLDDKIVYTLTLSDGDALFLPSRKNTVILLNSPAWILVDNIIYNLKYINGNKIAPFIKKQTVDILEKNSKIYFEKFIKDVVKHVEIEAEGFSIVQKASITKCIIKPYYNFFADCYLLDVLFAYEDNLFSFLNKKRFHSNIVFNDYFEVIQVKRDFEREGDFIEKALHLGLKLHDFGFFSFSEKVTHKYENIQLLIENISQVAESGFEIDLSEIENKLIANNFGFISLKYEENLDWFDVKMQIVCGDFSFSFVNIIPNLKSNNPFFELPNGTFFLIPNEWFSKYKLLIEYATVADGLLRLKKSQFPIIDAIANHSQIEISHKKEVIFEASINLKAKLRSYQEEGVKWLIAHYNNNLGACLADDMGLGKTLQTLALLTYVKENLQSTNAINSFDLFSEVSSNQEPLKALIIAPSSLIFNWKNESRKFTPFLKSIAYVGNDRKKIKNKLVLYDLIFTSYSIALKDIQLFKNIDFSYLILDESQYIKNKNSKIFEAVNNIPTKNKITLSGTPIENSLDDLWSQMQFINPSLLGTYNFFVKYFKNPIEKNRDEVVLSELKNLIKPYILRRTKEQVAKDLPPISEQIFLSEMTTKQKGYYEQEKSIARNSLLRLQENESVNKINVLNALMKLRQISNHPKLVDFNCDYESGKFVDVIEYLKTLIKSKQKVLLFSSFVKHIQIYTDWCKKGKIDFCLLTGNTSVTEREAQVNDFQNNQNKFLFFISLKAGGVGLNLTAASYVLILDPWWNPFAENQAIARAHRIGQKQNVTVVRFITKDTVEEKILLLQKKKLEIAETVIDVDYLPAEIEKDLNFILE